MSHVRSHVRSIVCLQVLLVFSGTARARDGTGSASVEFFEKKVRPVLVAHCLKCHGADPQKIKGGLRLNSRGDLLRGGDSGAAMVPGNPSSSRLIEAVAYKNVDLQMPPKGKLPDAMIADLTTWIRQGAAWPESQKNDTATVNRFDLARRKAEHWAWQPVRRPDVPAVRDRSWPQGSIDTFILKKLEDAGLQPAAAADKRTLLRRATFALIGLPPTVSEIDAFLNDSSANAYEKVIDRLLASPAFGERWARHWLDLVRYAESRGHEFDYPIPDAWMYRDYVIRAWNADVPYNQFVVEQVAGDCLESPRRNPSDGTNESLLGTGFWLLGEEVHSPVDIRQDHADRLDNRIDVLTKTFLGLTVGCARCHDHKFDAISTADYYSLLGILEGGYQRLVRIDRMDQERDIARSFARSREAIRAELTRALANDAAPAVSRLSDYLLAAREALHARSPDKDNRPVAAHGRAADLNPALAARLHDLAVARRLDESLLREWTAAVAGAALDAADPLHSWARLTLESEPDSNQKLSRLMQLVSEHLRAKPDLCPDADKNIVIDYSRAAVNDWHPDEGAYGIGPELPGSVEFVGADPTLQFVEHASAVYDRSHDSLQTAAGAEEESGALGRKNRCGRTIRTPSFTLNTDKLFYRLRGVGFAYVAVEGHSLISGPLHGQLVLKLPAGDGYHWVSHDLTPYKGLRAHVEFTPAVGSDLAIAKVVQADKRPAEPAEYSPKLLELLAGAATPEALAAGYQRYFQEVLAGVNAHAVGDPTAAAEAARISNWLLNHPGLLNGRNIEEITGKARAELASYAARVKKESRLAFVTMDGPGADEHVFIRGSHKTLGDKTPRRFLEAFAGSAPLQTAGSGRLELARQMVDPERSPLIARVIVNRIWHHVFGRGLVASTDNFGVLGERPTHPELLDFLADDFVRNGWSIKSMIRQMMLTRTYQMDSASDAASEAADPQDQLLHRMRLQRLEGEAIRDAILAVSGRLNPKQFERSVPVHLTPFLDGRGRPASGALDGEGRRSIYLAVRRNFLSPFLLAFDTPSPFSTVGKRSVSNVPAQALILLNDPFVHEQAGLWARHVLKPEGLSSLERIEGMYLSAYGRPPIASEAEACISFVRRQAEIRNVASWDEAPWADLAHTLFNVKEFIFVR